MGRVFLVLQCTYSQTKGLPKIQRERFADGNIKDETLVKDNGWGARSFYPDGSLEYDRQSVNGKEGIERRYYKNGQLESEVRYQNDKKVGSKVYYENGKLRTSDNCDIDKTTCIEDGYDEAGLLIAKREYRNGKIFNDLIGPQLTLRKMIQEKRGGGEIIIYENGVEYKERYKDGQMIDKKPTAQP